MPPRVCGVSSVRVRSKRKARKMKSILKGKMITVLVAKKSKSQAINPSIIVKLK